MEPGGGSHFSPGKERNRRRAPGVVRAHLPASGFLLPASCSSLPASCFQLLHAAARPPRCRTGSTHRALPSWSSTDALFPRGALHLELAPARWRDLVIARQAAVLRRAPEGPDPPAPLHPHQRGIERTLRDEEDVEAFRQLAGAPHGNAPARGGLSMPPAERRLTMAPTQGREGRCR